MESTSSKSSISGGQSSKDLKISKEIEKILEDKFPPDKSPRETKFNRVTPEMIEFVRIGREKGLSYRQLKKIWNEECVGKFGWFEIGAQMIRKIDFIHIQKREWDL